MSKTEGLKKKYNVERVDGKPLKGGCIVLEFGDPLARAALEKWAETMKAAGYEAVAEDMRCHLLNAEQT